MGNIVVSPHDKDGQHEMMTNPNSPNLGSSSTPKNKSEITVLLLGAGESGKSTLFKQVQYFHGVGITHDQERIELIEIVRLNVLENSKNLVAASQHLNIPIEHPENRETAKIVMNSLTTNDLDNPSWSNKLQNLWKDAGIQKAYENREKFQLYDSTEYLFENLDRICSDKYVPTIVDVIRTRTKTIGITDMKFNVNDGKVLRLVDVGGQRNERRKWIHFFNTVDAIVFLTSLSEFDLNLYEDNGYWRVKESLRVFNEVVNNALFYKVPFVLLFNKRDLFEKKISTKSFSKYFTGFNQAEEKNPVACIEFMTKLFLNEITEHPLDTVAVKTLSAIDHENTKQVFEEVKQFILTQKCTNQQ